MASWMEQVVLLAGEKQERESSRARQGCNDYLRMGPGRSLRRLLEVYHKSDQKRPPTAHLSTLKRWSVSYGWQVRAEAYDAQIEAQKDARAAEIMASGLALEHERVEKLKKLAGFLEGQVYEPDEDGAGYPNIWLRDVKQIGSGEDAERVDLERFNAPLIREYRGALDDLAKETGGRVHKTELTGAEGGPLEIKDMDGVLTDAQRMAGLVALYDRVRARRVSQAGDEGEGLGSVAGTTD